MQPSLAAPRPIEVRFAAGETRRLPCRWPAEQERIASPPGRLHPRHDIMMADLPVYAGLFLAAFVAATILPMQSEAVLVGLIVAGYPPWLLLLVASLGNVLGSVVNWLLGRGIERFRHRRWFPASEATLDRAQGWYRRWGKWSLLLSWAPIVGDPLTVVAGVLREPFPTFLLLVTIAKVGRYLVLAAATLGLS